MAVGRNITQAALEEFPEKINFVEPWFHRGSLNMVYAPTGVGKSYFALFMAFAIARGVDFLGWKTSKGRVAYFDGELGKETITRRIRPIAMDESQPDLEPDSFKVVSYDDCGANRMWDLANPGEQHLYAEFAKGTDIFILDNYLTCTFQRDNKDSEFARWERILPFINRLKAQGMTILIVHHTAKSGVQWGSVTKENAMDNVIELSQEGFRHYLKEDGFKLRFTKCRHLNKDDVPPLYVKYIDNGEAGISWQQESYTSALLRCVSKMKMYNIKEHEICKELGISKSYLKFIGASDEGRDVSETSGEVEDGYQEYNETRFGEKEDNWF